MALEELVVNKLITDWSKVELTISKVGEGQPSMATIRGGFKSLDFDYGIDGRENQKGNAQETVGQNEGDMNYSASCEVFEAMWKKVLTYVGDGFLSAEYQYSLNCAYKIDGQSHRVQIEGSMVKPSASWSQGNVLMRKLDLLPMRIRETDNNGKLIEPVVA